MQNTRKHQLSIEGMMILVLTAGVDQLVMKVVVVECQKKGLGKVSSQGNAASSTSARFKFTVEAQSVVVEVGSTFEQFTCDALDSELVKQILAQISMDHPCE